MFQLVYTTGVDVISLSVNRHHPSPLYYQIQQTLLNGINSGRIPAGALLPSEQEIARQTGVSRMTARQTLKALCQMGLTYSLRGKGTFVSGIKLVKDFRQVQSFTEEMKARGLRPQSRILSFKLTAAPEKVLEALRLKTREKVFALHRLRLANDSPMGIECTYLPESLCPGLRGHFEPSASLYDVLASQYGMRMTIADEVVEAGPARAKDARLLGIRARSAVFLFTRISYLQDGRAAEYVESTYRADRYKIVNRLTRLTR